MNKVALLTLIASTQVFAGPTPHRQIEALVNEGKFEEARKVESESRVPAYLGIKRIEVSEKCRPVIDDCNLEVLETQKVRQCLSNLELNCERKYLTQKYQDDFRVVWNKLSTANDEKISPDATKGMCDEGMKWGYVRETDSKLFRKAFTHNIDYKTLHGQFETKDKCEEARLLEKEGIQTSTTCYTRYIGETKKLTVYQATGMENTSKRLLTFKEKSSCEKATSEGYTYHSYKAQPITYSPMGSSQSIRFIKDCEETQITVCEKFKQGEQFLDDII